MSMTGGVAGQSSRPQGRNQSQSNLLSSSSESKKYGPFAETVRAEAQEFGQFEKYLETLHGLQAEIIGELEQLQCIQGQQASNYERLSESFTMLRNVKSSAASDLLVVAPGGGGDDHRQIKMYTDSSMVSMQQMDSFN